MFSVTPANINKTIIVIIRAIRVIAEFDVGILVLDVGIFDVNLFTNLCFSFGSPKAAFPTTLDLYSSIILILFLF